MVTYIPLVLIMLGVMSLAIGFAILPDGYIWTKVFFFCIGGLFVFSGCVITMRDLKRSSKRGGKNER